ncbi:Ig-like domain-containing protein [Aldersonia sp. NBC_00410]|uniref:L,D-transpeptidase n=1 Tax=Aldersonia sp. NBC_00410 TaxID=2975954 RepID=UPI00225A4DF1|nr:Ig-like domain-containing protein [Aldersonia sp. NBC_00410]MCX5041807.1 Ig-like domain-containing protein [Aldersonia sp. NBC_00410]
MRPSRLISLIAAVFALLAFVVACGDDATTDSGTPVEQPPVAKVTADPAADSTDINPTAPISVRVEDGVLRDVALTNANGKVVAGLLSPDSTTFTITEPLGYGATYTWSGTAIGMDNKPVPVNGSFTTVEPESTTSARVQIADGQIVGIAAPIILQFDDHVADKAAVERALTVTTNPPTVGSWAWLPDDNGSRVHWRPQNYWTPGTTVHVDAKLYGVDFGEGAYGDSDLTSDFAIGRSQIVKAEAPSHRMQVVQDGQVIFDFPVSYGEGNEARNVTRSGIHVVSEKHEDFLMSNPPYYENVRERWAVRISNNGEFIHANPETTGVQGSSNVTNGCINLSNGDAAAYYPTAMYGDPVEVTGTRIDLSAADGDIYDWTIDWPTWQSMSALDGSPASVVSATPVAPAPVAGG